MAQYVVCIHNYAFHKSSLTESCNCTGSDSCRCYARIIMSTGGPFGNACPFEDLCSRGRLCFVTGSFPVQSSASHHNRSSFSPGVTDLSALDQTQPCLSWLDHVYHTAHKRLALSRVRLSRRHELRRDDSKLTWLLISCFLVISSNHSFIIKSTSFQIKTMSFVNA